MAWHVRTKAVAPNTRAGQIAAFECTPVLAGDLLYVITPFDQVLALNPESGAEKWRYDPHVADREYSEASARGVTVSEGVVYFGTLDARLIALEAKTGKLLWQTEIMPGNTDGNYQMTSPPVVVQGLVIAGSSIGDNSRAEMERGVVRAFDSRTGKLQWSWDPTPPGRTGAANAWAPMSVDVNAGLVFIPTGSASPDFYGGLRPGDDLYANSVVALRAATGAVVWAFQVVHHDLWDYDVPAQPLLVSWKGTPAVAVLTKVGHYFVLDRATGKPLTPVEERAVPKSDVVGEAASATQPFPASGVFTEQHFRPRAGWCEDEFRKTRYEGVFTPPSLGGSLDFPGNVGGANWGGGIYDAQRRLLYVAENRLGTIVRLIPRDTFAKDGHGDTGERIGLEYGRQAGAPYGMARQTFLAPDHLPCNQKPWGSVTAIDVDSGQVKWSAASTISLGGPAQAGDLVLFSGDIFAKKLKAYSAATGEKIWEVDLPHTANARPAVYTFNGKTYVVVCAGGHGKLNDKDTGDDVVAFVFK